MKVYLLLIFAFTTQFAASAKASAKIKVSRDTTILTWTFVKYEEGVNICITF